MVDTILQVLILLASPLALYLIAERNKWGFVVGMVVQPAWIASTLMAEQWGMLILSMVYAVIYIRGFYKAFKKGPPDISNTYSGLARSTYKLR